jgi:hypothetical protein
MGQRMLLLGDMQRRLTVFQILAVESVRTLVTKQTAFSEGTLVAFRRLVINTVTSLHKDVCLTTFYAVARPLLASVTHALLVILCENVVMAAVAGPILASSK